MILDLIARLPLYEGLIPGAERIAAAFAERCPQAAPCEVRVKGYDTRTDADRRFEVHQRTIDLMMALEGSEVIHLCPASALTLAEPLPNGADGRKLDGAPQGSAIVLSEGFFCAIFPGEAHMVGGRVEGAPGHIGKWVVKVPCESPFRTGESA